MTPTLIALCTTLAICAQARSWQPRTEGCRMWFPNVERTMDIDVTIAWKNLPAQAKSCDEQRKGGKP